MPARAGSPPGPVQRRRPPRSRTRPCSGRARCVLRPTARPARSKPPEGSSLPFHPSDPWRRPPRHRGPRPSSGRAPRKGFFVRSLPAKGSWIAGSAGRGECLRIQSRPGCRRSAPPSRRHGESSRTGRQSSRPPGPPSGRSSERPRGTPQSDGAAHGDPPSILPGDHEPGRDRVPLAPEQMRGGRPFSRPSRQPLCSRFFHRGRTSGPRRNVQCPISNVQVKTEERRIPSWVKSKVFTSL